METKKCPICGASNSELAKFCYACGADLREGFGSGQSVETTAQPVSEPQPQQPSAPQQNPYAGQAYQAPPQGASYQQTPSQGNTYQQAPPQGNPYQQQIPSQGSPYQQMPPQGSPYQQVPPQGNPYQPQPPFQIPPGYQQKSKIAAGLLGILLGCFGVHNFYLGYTGKAVAQLLLTLIGWVACGLGPAAAAIWGLVEGIMILTGSIKIDGRNVPLSD